jgi:hypothetical protein
MLETFDEYGLSRSAEQLKDWRKVLEKMPGLKYKPKTKQITYDD